MIGLHTGLKLRRAGTEESRLILEEIINDLREFWIPEGQQHFREEEEILLPAFAQYASIDRQEIKEMLLEHVQIRSFIDTLLRSKEHDLPVMHELGLLLETHIRKEERVIFPMIEKALPEERLQELAPYFH
ncbi:hemerythrin [Pueribacillus theae]|uniref:Hemerythrin n=2 Tax=Pueribacillus theae TaxID=2171751 RepID=A0A2U1JXP5_9BACI|nr:hemerythrin [Pueribacillus theae]